MRAVSLWSAAMKQGGSAPVSLKQDCWPKVFVLIPPVAGAGCAAASAQDALIQPIQLVPVRLALRKFSTANSGQQFSVSLFWIRVFDTSKNLPRPGHIGLPSNAIF